MNQASLVILQNDPGFLGRESVGFRRDGSSDGMLTTSSRLLGCVHTKTTVCSNGNLTGLRNRMIRIVS